MSLLAEHVGLVTAAQVAVWALCVVVAAPALVGVWREQPRWLRALLPALALTAAAISLWLIPSLERFVALGHEASYFDCYTGASQPGHEGGWEPYVTYPLVRYAYWILGRIVPGEGAAAPLVFSALLRGLGVLLIGLVGAVLGRKPEVGAVAAGLLTLHNVHAFWGGGLYNVPLPHSLALLCLLLALLAWRSGSARVLLAAAASGSLVVAGRVEWGLLAPCLGALLLGLGPRWGRAEGLWKPRFWAGPMALAAVYAVTLFSGEGQLTEQGGYHGVSGYVDTIAHQVGILEVFEPLDRPFVLAIAAAGAVAWARRGDVGVGGPLGLLAFFAIAHLGLSTFNDASYRHALLTGIALVLAIALLAPELRGRAAVAAGALLGVVFLACVPPLLRTAERYYMSPEAFLEAHEGFAGVELSAADLEASGCNLITDDERLWGLGLAGSHFNLMDRGEAVKRWRHHGGCILWLYDRPNFRQDGLAVRIRGVKLMRWFDWEYLGWARFPDGLDAVVYRMASPPWGISDSEPVPETDVRLPWEEEEE